MVREDRYLPSMRQSRAWTRGDGVAAISSAGVLACLTWAALVVDTGRLSWLFGVLALGVVGADVFGANTEAQHVHISAAVLGTILVIAFFGPAWAFLAAILSELILAIVERRPPVRLALNLFGIGAPVLVAGTVFEALRGSDGSFGFYAALALAAVLLLVLNLLIAGASRMLLVSLAINVPLALAAAGLCLQLGIGGTAFAAFTLIAFSYMANLVSTARHRSRQYASLSWGVLSGLLRTLDVRDPRAARHAAAVAAFARDIARAAGCDEQECELVHTAGLLHDIGNFALSDRVAERGRVLSDEDWTAIRRHPELGADLLRDLGLYGPVAEIVRAHHERLDGRGYPDGLAADQIPELAKMVSVAEVYDTLTAHDTYRTPVSSFEALTELRRVSGTQLDGRYVEILATLLAGSDLTYRHADAADFGRELDLERRLNEAAAH
jgi:putative nucleotidyltransferase with HDIG domain